MRKTITKSAEYLVIPPPKFTKEEINDFKNLFKFFDHNKDGSVRPKDLVDFFKIQEIHKTCPQIYEIVSKLSTLDNNADGLKFQDIIDEIEEQFGQKMDKKEVKRIFELFLKDKTQEHIYLSDVKATVASLNLDYSHHDILLMLKDASALKNELTFEEFYVMLTESLIHV